jgi:hypothetical protein
MSIKIDFDDFHRAFERNVKMAQDRGVTLKDILIEYRSDLGKAQIHQRGEKNGKEMAGAYLVKVSMNE